ncbi:MAG: hypothetical protein M5R42_09950 [Rhodocyclaceae bacterium]|nr:hypothetical protein [Rhodocyclaceae bacterium]
MLNHYPPWKNILIAVIMAAGVLVALPNIFGEDPALQITLEKGGKIDEGSAEEIQRTVQSAGVGQSRLYFEKGRVVATFPTVDGQLRAGDKLREVLGKGYIVALALEPRTPRWLAALGLKPVRLGLDLRGGVHFLFQVDMEAALNQRLDRYASDFSRILRDNRIRRNVAPRRQGGAHRARGCRRCRPGDEAHQGVRPEHRAAPRVGRGGRGAGGAHDRAAGARAAELRHRAEHRDAAQPRQRAGRFGAGGAAAGRRPHPGPAARRAGPGTGRARARRHGHPGVPPGVRGRESARRAAEGPGTGGLRALQRPWRGTGAAAPAHHHHR